MTGGIDVRESGFGKRAIAAYYKTGGLKLPVEPVLEYTMPNGRTFVILTDEEGGLIAAYRHRSDINRLTRVENVPPVLVELAGRKAA